MVNHTRRLQIPRLYTLLRWLFLVVIAISTALVGFFQSMLVSSLYQLRSQFIYSIVVRSCAGFILSAGTSRYYRRDDACSSTPGVVCMLAAAERERVRKVPTVCRL